MRVSSRVAEQLKTYDLRKIANRKISNFVGDSLVSSLPPRNPETKLWQ